MNIAEENQYNCEYQNFQNGSRLYWQWNCDSAWLTFENNEKLLLKSCEDETVYGCQRAGLGFLKEYPSYLLFQYEWISGCCASPDILFISKKTGKEIERITQDLFVWGDIENDYLLYFSDTTFTSLVYLNHLTDKKYNIQFEPNKIDSLAQTREVLRLTELFENIQKNEDELTFELKLKNGEMIKKRIEIKKTKGEKGAAP
jgi:hypothetical protein